MRALRGIRVLFIMLFVLMFGICGTGCMARIHTPDRRREPCVWDALMATPFCSGGSEVGSTPRCQFAEEATMNLCHSPRPAVLPSSFSVHVGTTTVDVIAFVGGGYRYEWHVPLNDDVSPAYVHEQAKGFANDLLRWLSWFRPVRPACRKPTYRI